MIASKRKVLLECLAFVAGNPVQPDLSDADDCRTVEILWNTRGHGTREFPVVGLFGIHRKPGVVLDALRCSAERFGFRELPEVAFEAIGARSIPSGPKCGLSDGSATGERHLLIVVGRARHHVRVMIDVLHVRASVSQRSYAPTALFRSSAGIGSE